MRIVEVIKYCLNDECHASRYECDGKSRNIQVNFAKIDKKNNFIKNSYLIISCMCGEFIIFAVNLSEFALCVR